MVQQIKTWFKVRQLERMRETALKYMFLLDTQMKKDGMTRPERRRLKKELIKTVGQGAFNG